jgi:hypothetical protein
MAAKMVSTARRANDESQLVRGDETSGSLLQKHPDQTIARRTRVAVSCTLAALWLAACGGGAGGGDAMRADAALRPAPARRNAVRAHRRAP